MTNSLQAHQYNGYVYIANEGDEGTVWGIEKARPERQLEIDECSTITGFKKDDGKEAMATKRFVCDNTEWFIGKETYNDEYIHDWQFIPVEGERNTYNIVSKNGCQRKFLSTGAGCSAYVDTWTHDDGSAR